MKVFTSLEWIPISRSKHNFHRKCSNNKHKSSHKNHEDIELNEIMQIHIFSVDSNPCLEWKWRWGWVLIRNKCAMKFKVPWHAVHSRTTILPIASYNQLWVSQLTPFRGTNMNIFSIKLSSDSRLLKHSKIIGHVIWFRGVGIIWTVECCNVVTVTII